MKNITFPKKFIKNAIILLTLLFSLIPFYGYSTHIVGGELNYKCLGGNVYEIRLRVYRDCYTGQVAYDDPAAVGIFGSNNVLITTI
ncbi:MAG: hypothetical protein H0W84_09740, partial [Bacteroidetes bacterium]|nr:hypothetical protein [Bacteroidota bacterium]